MNEHHKDDSFSPFLPSLPFFGGTGTQGYTMNSEPKDFAASCPTFHHEPPPSHQLGGRSAELAEVILIRSVMGSLTQEQPPNVDIGVIIYILYIYIANLSIFTQNWFSQSKQLCKGFAKGSLFMGPGSKSRLRSSPNASWFAQPYFHLHNRSVKNYTACLHTHPACLKPHKTIKSLFSWWFLSKRYRKRKVTAVAQPKETKTQTSDLVTPTVCTNRSKLKMEITHSPHIPPNISHPPRNHGLVGDWYNQGASFSGKGDGIPSCHDF